MATPSLSQTPPSQTDSGRKRVVLFQERGWARGPQPHPLAHLRRAVTPPTWGGTTAHPQWRLVPRRRKIGTRVAVRRRRAARMRTRTRAARRAWWTQIQTPRRKVRAPALVRAPGAGLPVTAKPGAGRPWAGAPGAGTGPQVLRSQRQWGSDGDAWVPDGVGEGVGLGAPYELRGVPGPPPSLALPGLPFKCAAPSGSTYPRWDLLFPPASGHSWSRLT